MRRIVLKAANLAYTMLLVQGRFVPKYGLISMCTYWLLGLQGIIVKCTAVIFFHTVDCLDCSLPVKMISSHVVNPPCD